MSIDVFQWASGTVGRYAANAVIERSDMRLVGLHALSPVKVGRDAGEILGRGALGIEATGDIDAVCASSADVVIHAPLASLVYGDDPDQDLKDICRLLAAGKNVITVVGYMYPKAHGEDLVERLQSACRQGNSTFHSTGLNPGWLGDVLPLSMSALSARIERIVVREISNFQYYPSPEIMFDSMGFGSTPEVFAAKSERQAHWLNGLFRENVQMIADGIGLPLDGVTSTMQTELATEDLDTASGPVAKGTVAGQHWLWRGEHDGVERIVHETVWRIHASAAPDWPVGDHSVTIEGEPHMHINFAADWISDGLLATAMHAVNAIPDVVAAPAGIQTLLDLPGIRGRTR